MNEELKCCVCGRNNATISSLLATAASTITENTISAIGPVWERPMKTETTSIDGTEITTTVVDQEALTQILADTDLVVQQQPRSDIAQLIKNRITEGTTTLSDLVSARLTAIVGYFDQIFATKATLRELCLADDAGQSCYTRSQLDAVLNANNVAATPVDTTTSSGSGAGTTQPAVTPETEASNTTEPAITEVITENPVTDTNATVVTPEPVVTITEVINPPELLPQENVPAE